MERTITVNLTEREINALQICISGAILDFQNEIDHLKDHNTTGINTKKIKLKAERIEECDALWSKLYKAEQLLNNQ